MTLYLGLMSGTSMDGIDAALVDVSEHMLLYGITKKYSREVKQRIDQVLSGSDLTLESLCQLNTLIGKEFAAVANELIDEARVSSSDVRAIGSHGQTLCHNPLSSIPYTLQLGCPHTISSLTGITVVADFRTRDLVNGGQGAPFAPLYHQQLFRDKNKDVVVVNVGGISNITVLSAQEEVKGWDIGPGNCLMDAWIMQHKGTSYDRDGAWAQQGQVIRPLLEALASDAFAHRPAPKSFGKEYFSLSWLARSLKKEYKPVDVQKTLLELTAKTIAETILNEKNHVEKAYFCGGGTHNSALLHRISELVPKTQVTSSAEVGISPDYIEAMMFAWFASQTIHHIPLNLTAITGSQSPALLGALYLN